MKKSTKSIVAIAALSVLAASGFALAQSDQTSTNDDDTWRGPLARALFTFEGSIKPVAVAEQHEFGAAAGCNTYVAPGSLRAGFCEKVGFKAIDTYKLADADIRASTLFDGAKPTGLKEYELTRRFTVGTFNQQAALRSLMRNIIEPTAPVLTASTQNAVALDAYAAQKSLAQSPMQELIRGRVPTPENIPAIQRLLKDPETAAFTKEYLAKNVTNWKKNGVSEAELINMEVERRLNNKAWQAKIDTTTDVAAIAREQLAATAVQNKILWRLDQNIQQMNVLMGYMAANTARAQLKDATAAPVSNMAGGLAGAAAQR